MCEPATAMAVLAVVMKGMELDAQRQAATRQTREIRKQYKQKQDEIAAKASQEMGERARAGRRERGRIMVAAGESGLMGATFEGQLATSLLGQDMDIATINTDKKFALDAAENQANSLLSRIYKPSGWAAGLQLVQAGAQGYMAGGGSFGGMGGGANAMAGGNPAGMTQWSEGGRTFGGISG